MHRQVYQIAYSSSKLTNYNQRNSTRDQKPCCEKHFVSLQSKVLEREIWYLNILHIFTIGFLSKVKPERCKVNGRVIFKLPKKLNGGVERGVINLSSANAFQ